ncbi:S10 family peptidase [Bifidobacterium biavatii]|uniref:Peptidase S10, serine carboxypeptidase n=1 Tax=Bifidobacterium biavatii DSM 23969 TaxID=1437608 RepID=A0A086ZVY7_9BIFI|nr:hypothetical protein [Bifidobacterium biavatii]KFI50687.1 peptidase S10, serine carboxypeptidase [Bifidobacterium biavatii DSM 23969]
MPDADYEAYDRRTQPAAEPIADPNLAARLTPASAKKTLVTRDGASLDYTVTAGYFDLTEENIGGPLAEDATVKARVFLTQYVADEANDNRTANGDNTRPVIFLFNGGPGSSSAWLHLGLFGPRIVDVVKEDGVTPKRPPYQLRDNPDSPLAFADLVVVDAISTGYSRVATGETADQYHDADVDVEAMTNIIRLWITRNRRWNSPLYIAGESYGVLRGSAVTDRLAIRYGIYLSGLILISSPITLGRMDFAPGTILGNHAFLPTYAAVAHYHGFNADRTLDDVLAEAEHFADTDYLWALNQGHRLTEDKRREIIATYSRLTGLDEAFVDRADLKVTPAQFRAELLRSQSRVVGRNDGRFIGWDRNGLGETPAGDPADQVLRGAFAAGINSYLRQEVGYENDLSYEIDTTRVKPWNVPQNHRRNPFHVLPELSKALRTNRTLRVLYQVGHYDLCTPFWGMISDVALLEIPPELRGNVRVSEFDSGHMIYVDDASRIRESADIRRFVTEE